MSIKYLIILLLFPFTVRAGRQNEKQKWTAGISIASAKYSLDDGLVVGEQLAYRSPGFNISRYILKGLSLDAAFATAVGGNQQYNTFDGLLRYGFGTFRKKYDALCLVGGSFIDAIHYTPTANLGTGATFWLNSKIGFEFASNL